MITINHLQTLEQAGRYEEASQTALRALRSTSRAERRDGAVFLIAFMKLVHFEEILTVLKPEVDQFTNDFVACNAIAYAAWFRDDVELCRWASHRCIALNSAVPEGYLRLGMMELLKQRNVEAFCAFSAGLVNCPKEIASFRVWYKLSKALTQGVANVRFVYDNVEFAFHLSTFNGHAMETACQHIQGHFCEEEELRYIQRFVGHCDSVVEVGAAVGNHTVFFAKILSPKTVHVFDANASAVEHTKANAALNCTHAGAPVINIHHAAVGAKPGSMWLCNQEVTVVRLDDAVQQHVDFIKVDVDGMEMEVLEGCRGLIARDRPKIMIEVQNELKERFHAFIREYDYTIEHEIVRPVDTNYFIKPKTVAA